MKPHTPGQHLRQLREQLGPSQQVIAKIAGMSRPHLNHIENDERPWDSKGTVRKLMAVYGMTFEQLDSFVHGRMTLDEAVEFARVPLAPHLEVDSERKEHGALFNQAWKRALLHGPMDESTKYVARRIFEKSGWSLSVDRMAGRIVELNRSLETYIEQQSRVSGSHRTAPK